MAAAHRPSRAALRVLVAGLLVVLAALLPGRPAAACDCIDMTDDEARASADAVFRGEVVDVRDGEEFTLVATLDVAEAWEGPWAGEVPGTLEVTTPEEVTACGYRFVVGEEYLVFASGDEQRLSTTWCQRTAGAASASATLASWGEGELAVGAPAPPPGGDAQRWLVVGLVGGVVVTVLAVGVVARRRGWVGRADRP